MQTGKYFDVIISGGGLAGASMALALAKQSQHNKRPLSIALIDAAPVDKQLPSSFDARVLALANGSAEYLQQLGVWQQIKADATAIKSIHVSDRGHYGKARLYHQDYNVDALGYVVEMQVIGRALYQALKNYPSVALFNAQQIGDVHWHRDRVEVILNPSSIADNTDDIPGSQSLSATLLIGCDGGQSVCRRQAKIQTTEFDYQQTAIIANVECEAPHLGRAFERFTDSGPLAMLPMSNTAVTMSSGQTDSALCSLVWTLKPEQVAPLMSMSDGDFAHALAEQFGLWLGRVTKIGKRDRFDLKLIQANDSIAHRMALVGNAAHTLHPIAGQGFNLGIRDVKQLAQQIIKAKQSGADIGDFSLLQEYAQHRANDHQQVIHFTDSMVHLFSNDYLPLALGRGIGLKLLNYIAPLKQALAHKAMGHHN
ncbi:2-octaprenyl-6-methoxyphenyl hydroxylase [Thalassotalea ponticola]|uniref:2-octaprenyl-6-methoxyphenyl hydroxylase n=1 Tax=Thalassotalea ponticola TaxID=1523392 RepID=UPI0025B41D71|nr:2-octaprenyl-6-methoxyphenyl hydroxylase [Thalassotalea ponticola]MDN3651859.1 2-octaprenyl-6-methoxyphenyl hydroxylase [Thalassotalea ponticola]